MFHFTKEEKTILFLVAVVCATGAILHYALRRYPAMRDAISWMDQDAIYPKLDINTASFEDLVRLPYLGEYTARRRERSIDRYPPC